MNLTKESEYALQGLARLATYPSGTMVPMAEIATEQQLPPTFLAKIFQKLARHGLLEAERGRGSGYMLSGEPSEIRVREILEAVEGSMALQKCLLWGGNCDEDEPCPLHYRLKSIRPLLDAMLNEITLAEYMQHMSLRGSSPTSKDTRATS